MILASLKAKRLFSLSVNPFFYLLSLSWESWTQNLFSIIQNKELGKISESNIFFSLSHCEVIKVDNYLQENTKDQSNYNEKPK